MASILSESSNIFLRFAFYGQTRKRGKFTNCRNSNAETGWQRVNLNNIYPQRPSETIKWLQFSVQAPLGWIQRRYLIWQDNNNSSTVLAEL